MMTEEKNAQNMQKYENYREQFKRLDKALKYQFYLEAVFIAYAILEDRTKSILCYAGQWLPYLKSRKKHGATLDSKIKKIKKLAEEKKALPHRYFSDGILDEVLLWKEDRNRLIHALMNQALTTEELEAYAYRGKKYARTLTDKAGYYRRAVEREREKEKQKAHPDMK